MNVLEPIPTQTAVVAVKVETTPAVINFNHVELSAYLDTLLAKYEGLVFTEDTAKECKATIAELRKNQKALDDFRIATKRNLTASVTAFENQCKAISTKYDNVINPLTKQQDKFETDRKEKKREEVQKLIDSIIAEQGLTEGYTSALVITAEYLTKGKTLKAIKAELTAIANTAKLKQDKDAQDAELIKTKVDLANALYKLTNILQPDAYLRLLAFKSVTEIDLLITADAEKMNLIETKAAEALAAKALDSSLTVIQEKPVEPSMYKNPPVLEHVQSDDTFKPSRCEDFPAVPLHTQTEHTMNLMLDKAEAGIIFPNQKITALYKITGTPDELSTFENYLDSMGLEWIDLPSD